MRWMLFLALVSMPAWAADPAPRVKAAAIGQQACVLDYMRYCAGAVTPEAVYACFLKNQSHVSSACMAVVKEFK